MAGHVDGGSQSPRHPFAGTVVFVLFGGPALVTLLGPWLLSGFRVRRPFFGWEPWRWIGWALVAAGTAVVLSAWVRFIRDGRGTPSPLAETEHLVTRGAYRFIRNPMYVAILTIVLGEALVLGSRTVLVYAAAMWIVFEAFVRLYEEPRLRRRFGAEYADFCRDVPRWIPRLSARRG